MKFFDKDVKIVAGTRDANRKRTSTGFVIINYTNRVWVSFQFLNQKLKKMLNN